ncbi:hypothetical protein A2W14_03330 [Candidatus Gottesmanbacteria bacterium RBG_16_37_8]|uniref:Uncharacterized protein n=1 Tax=Candidatus Gottesmanbacteria bacterium RBG_16_37_8 TaxID=1798371 RepID=A0A1F5YU37_9BACT|nr:MAG: hypothetical protein A2W14_03330 [Candidatus Gottesmanbacteria bacterium RBG_16_37_8]
MLLRLINKYFLPMIIFKRRRKTYGQTIVELLITVALTAIIFPALITGLVSSREGKAQQKQKTEAYSLIKEAEEAVRLAREVGWDTFAVNGPYHPEIAGNTYVLVPNSQTTAVGFTRTILIEDALRDSAGNIADSGTIDPSTKKVTITVSWLTPYSTQLSTVMYLSRFRQNSAHTDTTEDDFNAGTVNGVTVANDEGGEVILGAGGSGSWCDPNLTIEAVDLPKQGVANAVSAIEGQVVAGTGENASGVSFAAVSISNPPDPTPPDGDIVGTFDGFKTNDVFGEQNYAYLATDTNSKEIVIIDLTSQVSGKYAEAGYYNAPGNTSAESVYVSGNIGFAIVNNILYTFDLSSKTDSRSTLSSYTLAANGKEVVVRGNYAYVAVNSTSNQLQIIEFSADGTTLTLRGSATLNGGTARDIFVNNSASRAYIATAASTTLPEMFIVDVSDKNGSRPTVGTYEANGMDPTGVTIVPGNRAILVGQGAEEYQVIRTTTESVDPPMGRCGGLNIDSGVKGVSSVLESDGDAFSYIITGDTNWELKIIEGGPGGQLSPSGDFESAPFDAGGEVAFNRIDFTVDIPSQTTFNLQVAVTNAINNNCDEAVYTFVGPDGQGSSFYTSDGAIPEIQSGNYTNPGRCFKYKTFFSTSDSGYTPVLKDVTVNYSP